MKRTVPFSVGLFLSVWAVGLIGAAVDEPTAGAVSRFAAAQTEDADEPSPSDASATGESETADAEEASTESGEESANAESASNDSLRTAKAVTLTLQGLLAEAESAPGLFGELQPSMRQWTERLQRVREDDEISAVVLRIRSPYIGTGKLHELRSAIAEVRRSGKRVYADLHLATSTDYLLACACDRIVMPESGMLLIPGLRAEVTFYKDLLDKLAIQADMMQMGDYKGAAEPLTRNSMSESFRKQYELLVDDLYDQMADTIATDRKMERDRVHQLIDQGLFTARAAHEAGLIDELVYEDELFDHLKDQLKVDELKLVHNYGRKKVDTDFSGMMGFVKLMELFTGKSAKTSRSRDRQIAVVYAEGIIMTGKSQVDMFGNQSLGGDTIVQALKDADENDRVAAVILRVDSPGGSALASDLIWRQTQNMNKPIIASMGDLAASGGYYISMGCDKIIAEPGTLTGSIGVVGGKLATGGLFEKIGVRTEVISRGQHSGILSSDKPFSDSERKVFSALLEDIYRQFTAKAAECRKMQVDRLESLAGGRIWTGRQAEANGLVDQLGTLKEAVRLARELAEITESEETEIIVLPKPRSFFEQLFEEASVDSRTASHNLERLLGSQSNTLRHWAQIQQLATEPVLYWLPWDIRVR